MWGIESRDSRFIRQGISRLRRKLNPGAKSLKRQEQGKRQYQGFKPKPEEPDAAAPTKRRGLPRVDRGRA
jgi:hypothetical protein